MDPETHLPKTDQEVYEFLEDGTLIPLMDSKKNLTRMKVRKIPQRGLQEFADIMHMNRCREEAEIAAYLGISLEQFEQLGLTDESQDAVMEEGRRLNFTRFEHFVHRSVQLAKLSGDGVVAMLPRPASTTSPRP